MLRPEDELEEFSTVFLFENVVEVSVTVLGTEGERVTGLGGKWGREEVE